MLKPYFGTLDPGLKMREHLRFRYCNFFYPITVPDAGLQKRANFSTLIVGLAVTGDQTRATCVAGSRVNHSAIHYDF
jgi:hypothetical protein